MAAIDADAFCLPSLDSPPSSPLSTHPISSVDAEAFSSSWNSSYDGTSQRTRRPRTLMGMTLAPRRGPSQSLSDLYGSLSDEENYDGSRKRALEDGDDHVSIELAQETETSVPDSINYDAPRKKVKYRHSRIARPRDSMPGYRRNRSGGRGRRSGTRGRFSSGAQTNVGARHLDRGMSSSAYYGGGSGVGGGGAAGDDDAEAAICADIAAREAEQVAKADGDLNALSAIVAPVCSGHGRPCKRVTAKRGANKGREFYACAHERRFEQCSFFSWVDAPSAVVAVDDLGRYASVAAGSFTVPEALVKDGNVADIDKVANKHFGIKALRNEQKQAVELLRNCQSTLVVLPTGGGKSLVYQLHAALNAGVVLVVTPLVSLMRDQELRMPACLPCASLRGGQSVRAVEDIERKLQEGKLKVLLVSAERLFAPRFRALVRAAGVGFFSAVVVDEAHCISEWSHNFRTSYLRLSRALFGGVEGRGCVFDDTPPPILALTATATTATTSGICDALRIDKSRGVVRASVRRANLTLGVSVVRGNNDSAKPHELVRVLTTEPYASVLRAGIEEKESRKTAKEGEGWGGSARALGRKSRPKRRKSNAGAVLVYVSKQRECANVCNFLKSSNLSFGRIVAMYHAGLPSHDRDKTQKEFEEGRVCVLVATVAFGMGLNVANVRGVIHYDLPFSLESYAQEVGRAGRDGNAAVCHALVSKCDKQRLVSRCYSDGVETANVRKFVAALVASKTKLRTMDTSVVHDENSEAIASAETGGGSNTLLYMEQAVLEAEHDLKAQSAETIVSLLERNIEGVQLMGSGHTKLIVQFFTHTPDVLLSEPHRPPLSAHERRVVSAIKTDARARNGCYELKLATVGMLEEEASRGLRRLLRERCVKMEMRDVALRVLCTSGGAEKLENCVAVEAARAVAVLQRIEWTRVRKARAVCAAFIAAEELLSAQVQSKQLHDALERYFAEYDDDALASVDNPACNVSDIDPALRRAIASVLGCTSRGKRAPRTPREVARILHGIQSAAFSAKAWYDCGHWAKWIHVEFATVKAATASIIRSQLQRWSR